MCRWRVGAHWYAVALLTAPLVTMGILFMLSLTSPAFLPTIVTAENKAGLLLSSIVLGLVVCFFEELGWTGFAVPAFSACRERGTRCWTRAFMHSAGQGRIASGSDAEDDPSIGLGRHGLGVHVGPGWAPLTVPVQARERKRLRL